MLDMLFFFILFAVAFAGYADSDNYMNDDDNERPYGFGGRFGGARGFGGAGGFGYGFGGFPHPRFPRPFFHPPPPSIDFNNIMDGYMSSINKHREMITNNIQQMQQNIQDQIAKNSDLFTQPGSLSISYGPGGASFSHRTSVPYSVGSSASIGNGIIHQTAFLDPENPENPNVNVHFAQIPNGDSYSIFTSSVSGAGNVDGKPYGFRRAQTTVNDNGKISSYRLYD